MTLRYMDSNLRGPDASNEMRGKRPIGYRPLGGYTPPPPQQIGEPSFTQPPSARKYLPENYNLPQQQFGWPGNISMGPENLTPEMIQGIQSNTWTPPERERPPGMMGQSRGYSPTRRRYTNY